MSPFFPLSERLTFALKLLLGKACFLTFLRNWLDVPHVAIASFLTKWKVCGFLFPGRRRRLPEVV